ncbi:branched-chain amino acid ABC transporter permease [Variovorax sp. YR752]|uniref:branched-chain amino acid ABC transporter permease n=1 Tax=Variovorax sp. YR752 TaxID=1884383 RepID=UPI00313836BB
MALVLVLCAVPFVVDGYRSFQVATILLYAVALIGLNLLTGYNGQISLGHGAFFALGGYVTAILSATFGVPFWLTVPLAGLVGLIVGFLFGLPALRLGSLYLALATFSLALAVPQLLKWKSAEFITGGVLGIALQKPSVPAWLPLTQDQLLYLFTLLVAVVMYVLAHNLVNSRIGRALIAIRERPIAATAAGINVAIVKSTTFGVSVMFTAVAGALSALLVQYVAPDSFSLMLSITMLVGIIVGGTASLAGPVVGAIFITLIPNVAESISKSAPGAIYGACLLIVVLCMPRGIWGAVQSVVHRFCRRKAVGSSKVP